MLIDLSHVIEHGTLTYKGLPAPVICDYLSREESKKFYSKGTEFQIGKIEMVANTGTYIDCPFHRYADGKDLAAITLEQFTDLPGIVIRADHRQHMAIDEKYFTGLDVSGKALLINTNWDEYWNTEMYFDNHPFLTEAAAKYLVEAGAKLVGIDSHNIDDTRANSRPVHSILLGNEVLIVEHMCNLKALPNENFLFSAIPPKFRGLGTFPVRALAKLNS
ncbi:MAG TPA: cyclase family protein [Cyclobacteriaceae bacterium]|nr:cyclase family protein [Cyclobacteriaceae bacterium]